MAESLSLINPIQARRYVNATLVAGALLLVALVAVLSVTHGTHWLQNSGDLASSSSYLGKLSSFVTSGVGQIKYAAFTCVAIALAVIFFLFMFGHASAHTHAIKVTVGVVGFICLSGIVA